MYINWESCRTYSQTVHILINTKESFSKKYLVDNFYDIALYLSNINLYISIGKYRQPL